MSLDDSLPVERTTQSSKEKAGMTACIKSENVSSEGYKGQTSCQPASESEKDSGFSDTSWEDLSTVEQTDTDDQSGHSSPRSLNPEWPEKPAHISSAFTSLTPIYIIKNVILKQPLPVSTSTQFLHPPLPWNGQHTLNMVQGQAQVLVIQQPLGTTLKPVATKRKLQAKDTYLPILNSYPKIAPHPYRNGDNKNGSQTPNIQRNNKNKRLCVEETRESFFKSAVFKRNETVPVQKQSEQASRPALLPPPSSLKSLDPLEQSSARYEVEMPISHDTVTSSSEQPLPPAGLACSHQSISASDIAEGKAIAKASKSLASNLRKQRRFHNTVDILKKTGLLGITLKIKELIRKNRSTQRDVSELKEHTRLLDEAMQSNNMQAWVKLQEAMHTSASYWDKRKGGRSTKNLQDVKCIGASMAKHDTNS
ncbi:CLOCK-interacting pacemaker [Rhinatrema bivittatum]|uniref:CLOCK-interacting pacemaker n=1 Tax=Rhinatrema bivittatum TaxID=194408 RepID=UPI0011288463|nr:CLOCK-interacting pacemaker [Rhinatrema bivittatum]XP_029475909.1 CLOCK-interacting pacemaker [Rhinatrema bivittatum]XP_029475910.1 CLOCK-interacting pacemaker [Rhinatrema bivittatum]